MRHDIHGTAQCIATEPGGYHTFIDFYVVNDADGKEIGTIAAIDDSTANVLFELEDGKLIPVAEEFIKTIDSDKREIRVTLPEGLLEL